MNKWINIWFSLRARSCRRYVYLSFRWLVGDDDERRAPSIERDRDNGARGETINKSAMSFSLLIWRTSARKRRRTQLLCVIRSDGGTNENALHEFDGRGIQHQRCCFFFLFTLDVIYYAVACAYHTPHMRTLNGYCCRESRFQFYRMRACVRVAGQIECNGFIIDI